MAIGVVAGRSLVGQTGDLGGDAQDAGQVFGRSSSGELDPSVVGVNSSGAVAGAMMLSRLIEEGYMPRGARYAEMESGFVASVDYPLAVEAIRKVLPKVELALTQAADAYPGLMEERKKQTAGPDAESDKEKKKAMDATVAKEKTDFLAKVAALKKNKIPVVLFNAYDLKTITDAQAVVKKETVRLTALNLAALTATAKKFEQGLKDLNDKAYLSAKSNIEAVSKIHSKDVVVKKKLDEANKGVTDSKTAKPGAAKPAAPK